MKHWSETRQVLDRLAELERRGVRAALATVVRVHGSAYRHEGAKMLVAEDGSSTGNVSGGCLELDVREIALQVIASGTAQFRSYCSSTDDIKAWDLGVGCEGEVGVYIEPASDLRRQERVLLDGREPFAVCTCIDRPGTARIIVTETTVTPGAADSTVGRARELLGRGESASVVIDGETVFVDVFTPPPTLLVVSAGDDARPLARLGLDVGFRVVVADRRPGLLSPDRFPVGTQLLESDALELSERLAIDEHSYAVVMTHNFADDEAYLRALLSTPVAYIGMLGPRQRTERILANVEADGFVDEERIYGPVGLDVGTDGAEQVALAVIAEILAVRSRRRARSLRERHVPIHAAD